MKKTRLLLSTAIAFVMACGVGVLAVGCDDPKPETYTLTYEKGTDEEGTAPEAKEYEAGASVTLAAADTFTKEGFTFTKWLDDATEYDALATFTMPARNVTLKAKWEQDEPVDPSKLKLGDNEITLGADDVHKVTVWEENDTDAWGRTVTFTGEANQTYTITLSGEPSNFTIYASEEAFIEDLDNYLLAFYQDDNSIVIRANADGIISLYLDGGSYEDGDTIVAGLKLEKGGEITYKVTFYDNLQYAGSPGSELDVVTVNEGGTVSADDMPECTPDEGYTFVGWFIAEADGSGWMVQYTLTDTEFTTSTVVNENMVVGAKFEEVVCNVAFYEDEDSETTNTYFDITWGNSFNDEFADDNTKTFPVASEKTGYTFLGWYVYEYGQFISEFDADTEVRSELKLVARYVYNGDGKDELIAGDNELTLGFEDVDEHDEIGRLITFQGKANTPYTISFENNNWSPIFAWKSIADYEADPWGAILDGIDTTAIVLVTDGGGTLSLYLNGSTFSANDYSEEDFTITLTIAEGAHVVYNVGFYDDIMSSTTDTYFEITWGNSFNTEFANDDTKTFPTAPVKVNATFIKWVDEEGNDFTADTVVTSEMKIYGTWNYTAPTATYNNGLKDGEEETESVATAEFGEADQYGMFTLSLADATKFAREHYKLIGWTVTDKNGAKNYDLGATVKLVAGDTVTITARWEAAQQYTVTFYASEKDLNAGTDLTTVTVYSGDTLAGKFPQVTAPDKQQLEGWFSASYITPNPDLGETWEAHWVISIQEYDDNRTVIGNLILVAQFEAVPDPVPVYPDITEAGTFQVSFENNQYSDTLGDGYDASVEGYYHSVKFDVARGYYTVTATASGGTLTIIWSGRQILLTVADGETKSATIKKQGSDIVLLFVGSTESMTATFTVAPQETATTTSLETLSANGFDAELASLSAAVNKGETLTVSGDMELTAAEAQTTDGIFVGVADSENYVLSAPNGWIQNSQNDSQTENNALNLNLIKSRGFTEEISGGLDDNLRAMFLKKTLN